MQGPASSFYHNNVNFIHQSCIEAYMHMKKAVTLIKGILKLPKLRKKDVSKDESSEHGKSTRPFIPNFTTFRPCKRCVLVFENTIWASLERQLLLQHHGELVNTDYAQELQFNSTHLESDAGVSEKENTIRGFFSLYGLWNSNQGEFPVFCNKSCMSSECLTGHTFFWLANKTRDELQIGPHFPTFVFLTKSTEKWPTMPFLYEDFDLILFRASLSVIRSLLDFRELSHEFTMALNAEIWVVLSKIQIWSVSLLTEEVLVFEYLDSLVWSAFFDVPKSRDSRAMHLEALYQAVDQIMDISLYITLTSGIPPENQSLIKDTIIQTATVVTSTAAESTATVGIETAAMAMGQAAAGVALSVLVDVGITAGMVTRAKIRRDKGLISQKEFQKTVRYKLCDSGCQFIGGTAGTIVGQVLIPVPVVGAIVGGFCGSLLGAGVSKGIIKTSEIISKSQAAKLKAITEK